MPEYKAPLDDIKFLLNDVFDFDTFCEGLPALADVDGETMHAILEEAAKIAEQVLSPLDTPGDRSGCQWDKGQVSVPDGFKDAYAHFIEGSWGALGGDPEYGGMGMPKLLVSAVEEMVQGANMAFGLAPMLTAGACLALHAHGSEALKRQYLPKMYSGQWSGAMDLTEAHAGTDLGLMRTRAMPQEDGSYLLTGTKIFITWGEHDMAENIVHLVLAKLPDAPPGSKGISLFLAPKIMVDDDGVLLEKNKVSCGSIEHKMGIHGSATCVMNFDGATAWMVGEVNQGLACMFTMMNYERLVVGIQGIGAAEASYQTARNYAMDRLQGRSPSAAAPSAQGADPIVVHPDVRRMLLEMKSLNEASRAFYFYVASWLDLSKYSQDDAVKATAEDRVALLTPVVKAFLSDRALDTCITGQQVLGGHGYIQEWGQEQHVRDVRITQIYEGTNGVQAMDLMGRKIMASQGQLLDPYIAEMRELFHQAQSVALEFDALDDFEDALSRLERTTNAIVGIDDVNLAGAIATDYLDLVGYVSFAYMWLKILVQGKEKNTDALFMSTKKKTAMFFFKKMLPKTHALELRIGSGASPLMSLDQNEF